MDVAARRRPVPRCPAGPEEEGLMSVAHRLPGPKGSWFVGNLPEFRRDRLAFFAACAREYGDHVALRFGPRRILLLSDPAGIEDVLVTRNHNFIKHFALRFNSLVLGKGLLTSEGDFWLRQRRLAQPAFQRQRIASYGDVMVEFTQRMLDAWQPGRTVDVLAEMMEVTLRIAAKVLFDADAASEAHAVGEALHVAQECFIQRFNSAWAIPLIVPTPQNLRLRRAVRRLDEVVYGFIRQRRACPGCKDDLLSRLLSAQEEDGSGRMTDKQLRDEAMTLFLAGHETTALTLAWTWYALATNPAEEEKLVAEVREVVGDRVPGLADLSRLKHTERIVMETMRLYPPAYVIGREALSDFTIGGYLVPAGHTVMMSQWVVHRDPRWWDRADEFRPDRWMDTTRLPKFAYFPFGGGPRLCIGNTFAMMETVLMLAAIAQRYRFTLLPGHVVEPWPTFTLRPRNGIKAVLTPRAGATDPKERCVVREAAKEEVP
jgi:cytochrome P450